MSLTEQRFRENQKWAANVQNAMWVVTQILIYTSKCKKAELWSSHVQGIQGTFRCRKDYVYQEPSMAGKRDLYDVDSSVYISCSITVYTKEWPAAFTWTSLFVTIKVSAETKFLCNFQIVMLTVIFFGIFYEYLASDYIINK